MRMHASCIACVLNDVILLQAGRYPHLVKTDRKHDGLNVYQLDESKVPPSVAIATAKAMAASDESDGCAEHPCGGSERSSE